MFFRLTNSLATFQTMMNTIFHNLINKEHVMIYMNDIAIHTEPRKGEMHKEHVARHRELVWWVLERLKINDLHLNLEKCVFEQDHLDFLEVRITNGVVEMEQAKVNRVKEWTQPPGHYWTSPNKQCPGIRMRRNNWRLRLWGTRWLANRSCSNPTSMKHSTYKQTLWIMVQYSYKKEERDSPHLESDTQLPIIRPPSPQPNKTTTPTTWNF